MLIKMISGDIQTVTLSFDGEALNVRENLSVAAALLEAGITHFRDTPVTHSARAPFCMMGACFDCLLIIDGMPNQQSCMTQVREGMIIERQSGVADVIVDTPVKNGSQHE